MVKNKMMDATTSIVNILDPLTSDERSRVLNAAMTLLGEVDLLDEVSGQQKNTTHTHQQDRAGTRAHPQDPKAFFDGKEPKDKGEEIATAARYREQFEAAEASSKEEIKAVLSSARRNFDASNYARDLNNARTKGLFNKGTGKDSAVLSHYGQSYVDAMPDRDAISKLKKPKGAGARRASPAKKRKKG